MNSIIRNLKFWGMNCLECIGMTALGALVLIFIYGIGSSDIGTRGFGGMLVDEFSMYPYYLFTIGGIIVMVVTVSYYQVYFSLLVSMNCTRREVAGGVVFATAATVLGITAAAAVIWLCLPGDISSDGIRLLPLLAGVLFAAGAFSMVMGVVVMRWGKIGMIVFGVIGAGVGGVAGALAVLSSERFFDLIRGLQFNFNAVLAGGLVSYAAASIFIVAATRKLEVRC